MNRKIRLVPRQALLAVALLLGAPAAAAADASLLALADAPAWHLSRSFVAAYNDGDARTLRAFLKRHLSTQALRQVPLETRVVELLALRRQLGEIEVMEVSGVSHVLVLNTAAARGAGGADVVVVASPEADDRLDELQVVRSAADLAQVVP